MIKADPVSTVEVTAFSVFFIDAAKKGHLSPDSRTHWHHVFCLLQSDLDYSVLDAPCENICLSFQSPKSQTNASRSKLPLIGLLLAWSEQAAAAWPTVGFLSHKHASSSQGPDGQPIVRTITTDGQPIVRTHMFCNQIAFAFFFFYRIIIFKI